MIGPMFGRRDFAEQPVAANRAHVRAIGAENAGLAQESDVRSVRREDIPTIDEGEILTF